MVGATFGSILYNKDSWGWGLPIWVHKHVIHTYIQYMGMKLYYVCRFREYFL